MDNKAEAHYLCGILNSTTVAEFVESHNVAIQVGDIFKHMRLPKFDPANQSHVDLAKEVEAAYKEADATKRGVLVDKIREDADALMETWLAGLRKPAAKKAKKHPEK